VIVVDEHSPLRSGPRLAVSDDALVVAYSTRLPTEVRVARFDLNGSALSPALVTVPADDFLSLSRVAMTATGEFAVLYTVNNPPTVSGSFVQRFSSDGSHLGGPQRVGGINGEEGPQSILILDSGEYLVLNGRTGESTLDSLTLSISDPTPGVPGEFFLDLDIFRGARTEAILDPVSRRSVLVLGACGSAVEPIALCFQAFSLEGSPTSSLQVIPSCVDDGCFNLDVWLYSKEAAIVAGVYWVADGSAESVIVTYLDSPTLFADGFESGSTENWDVTIP